MHEALRIDPKFWNARFNLAEIPFLKKNWAEARNRFQELLTSNASELQGDAAAADSIQDSDHLSARGEREHGRCDRGQVRAVARHAGGALRERGHCLSKKNDKEAKDAMTAAEKNFSPQLNKLFAESLYEVGWLEKQAGQTRAALELNSPAEQAAKSKAFARSQFEQASRRSSNGI